LWVEGMGKCQIIEKSKISEKDIKLEAEKLAKEKAEKEAKQEAELKAQILAEEKAKQEAKLKAQILEEEKQKLKEELRKKIRAELKEKQLAKERAILQDKEEARQKAQKLEEEKARLAKENARKKAQELAREKARIKAEKIAKEKAKKEAARKAQNKKDFLEHKNLISDIQIFLSIGSSFDPVKIANLFVKFNGLAQGKWTANTFKAYRDLKNYALSFDEFKNFTVEQDINRENLKQEKINKLSESLREKSTTLKEFITKNLTSKKTPRALELISKIEKILPSESINKLEKLNQEVGDWILNMDNKSSVIKKNEFNSSISNPKKSVIENNVVKKEKLKTNPNVENSINVKMVILDAKKQTAYRCADSVPPRYKDLVMSSNLRQGNNFYIKAIDQIKNNNLSLANTLIDSAGRSYDNSVKQSQQMGSTNC